MIAFDDPARRATLLHRVEGITRGRRGLTFSTRGDANNERETWTIAPAGRLGRYTGLRIPAAGHAILRLRGATLALLLVLCLAVVGTSGLRRIWGA